MIIMAANTTRYHTQAILCATAQAMTIKVLPQNASVGITKRRSADWFFSLTIHITYIGRYIA